MINRKTERKKWIGGMNFFLRLCNLQLFLPFPLRGNWQLVFSR